MVHTNDACHTEMKQRRPTATHCNTLQHTATHMLHTNDACHTEQLMSHISALHCSPPNITRTFMPPTHEAWHTRMMHVTQNKSWYTFQASIGPSTYIEWRRLIGCLELPFIFRKRATNSRALLREMIALILGLNWCPRHTHTI